MSTAILYVHLLLAAIFLLALWKGSGAWARAGAMAGLLLLLTGIYNFVTRMEAPPPGWHAGIGVKVLLALHAIAVAFLLARNGGDPLLRARRRRIALVTATAAALIGLYFSNFAKG
jgi:hypothetical protein